MITSTSNGQIKKIQQLLKKSRTRKEEGLFVAEGIKMFREAPRSGSKRYIWGLLLRKKEPGERSFWKRVWKKKPKV